MKVYLKDFDLKIKECLVTGQTFMVDGEATAI